MDDYINREDAVHIIMGQPPDAHYPSWYAAQIEAISAADVVPVVHGRWEHGKCNLCGEHAPYWCLATTYHESMYCPNCGAKMDGGENT